MPLVHSEKIEETSTLLLWKLTETEQDLLETLGSVYNLKDLSNISHPQKKREWLASRILIKILAEQFGVIFKGTYKDDHGKVFLLQNEAHISITHTYDYVAAILNPVASVGIDMEKLDPKLQRTAKKYLNDREFNHAANDLTTLATYWCAKEALYKLYGKNKVSFKDNIEVLPFSAGEMTLYGTVTWEDQQTDSKIHLRWFENYCLAMAV